MRSGGGKAQPDLTFEWCTLGTYEVLIRFKVGGLAPAQLESPNSEKSGGKPNLPTLNLLNPNRSASGSVT